VDTNFRAEIKYLSGSRPKRVVYYLAQVSDHGRMVPPGEGIVFGWFPLRLAADKAIYKNVQEMLKQAHEYIEDHRSRNPPPPLPSQNSHVHSMSAIENGMRGGKVDHRSGIRHSSRSIPGRAGGEREESQGRWRSESPSKSVGIAAGRSENGHGGRVDTTQSFRQSQFDHQDRENNKAQSTLPSENPLFKTRLCERYELEGTCPYGNKCTFAHGTGELRERSIVPDVIAHDNPLYKTRLCERFVKEGFCQYGPKCNFAHGAPELRHRVGNTSAGEEDMDVSMAKLVIEPTNVKLVPPRHAVKPSSPHEGWKSDCGLYTFCLQRLIVVLWFCVLVSCQQHSLTKLSKPRAHHDDGLRKAKKCH
jgi:hypothetical protein